MRSKKNDGFKYLNFGLSFGLTLAVALYLLYKGGAWLDQRLGTEPLFTALGVVLALATVFRQIVGEICELGQKDDQEVQEENKKLKESIEETEEKTLKKAGDDR